MQLKTFSFVILLNSFFAWNQELSDSNLTSVQKPEIEISGFLDVFYVYDFNQPKTNFRQPFLYNHNRHNEFNVNLALIKLKISHEKYRSNLAFQSGTYVHDNYANEEKLIQFIHEANIGISLNKKNNLWLDAGVFPSHIGFESAISIDNMNLTRSLLAENSPYFLSGLKITHNPSKKVELAALVLNGWQRIQRLEGNSMPSFGTQIAYTANDKIMFNWSTFIGTDDPDSTRRIRYFNNFYSKIKLNKKIDFIVGFDLGIQQKNFKSSAYNIWYSPVFITQIALNKTWKTAIRAEYYDDENEVIINTSTLNGFKTLGFSLNFDYQATENLFCRIESRYFNSKDKIFQNQGNTSNSNFIIAGSLALKFSEKLKK
jgi:hypothetical protein